MGRTLVLASLWLLILPSSYAETKQLSKDRGNSMIAKVIEMLGEEKDKIKADLAAEANTMAEYMAWCDDTQDEFFYGIKSAKAKIEELTATITDNAAQIAALDEELTELGTEIADRQSDMEEQIATREKEHAVFLKAESEQSAMVEELEDMGVALKKQIASFTQTPAPVAAEEAALLQQTNKSPAASFDAFLQIKASSNTSTPEEVQAAKFEKLQKALVKMVNSVWIDPETKKKLGAMQTGLIQEAAGEGAAAGQDPMAAMAAQNEANLAMFEGLKGKAEEALQKLRDDETKKQGEHDIQMMSLKQAIALAENNVDDAKKERSRLAQEKSEAEEEKVDVEASKAADEKSLEETKLECEQTSVAWATRQKEAAAEMSAIEKAKEILASRVTVLIQVTLRAKSHSSNDDDDSDVQASVKAQKTRQLLINHFRSVGNKLHSHAMLNLVSVAAQDPMEQVKGLLTDLIAKLEKEAKEAADLHEFCQAEKKKTKAAMEKKTAEIDKLSVRIEKATATKAEQEELIATNSEEIAAVQKQNAEATKIRNEQHENFVKIDTDFSGAAEAVDDAIDALKEYYGSFVQVNSNTVSNKASKKAPPKLGGAKTDAGGGIISILETMGEEFRKSLKSVGAEERATQSAYDTMIQENKESKAAKDAEIAGSQSEIKSLSVAIHNFGGDKKMASKELGSVEEYVAKLKPQCGGKTVSYAERKAKMEAEITGLKDALAILEADAPAGSFNFLQIRQQ
eukprot:gnl/MRDRNA2_/MRDRNA2_86403_c0_seq8.p1 gnl/MRDRNA2_/MRDRNA2_86403_c0~~gnl/MRDRNA2_/MRDRNA2_86403_c0_seq8.p1  ORF type:complete len:741 (+),score=285.31 gnl/MRDRNA2_/MRDRNA2_86403_c0_seq8:88-2310(+)